MPGRGCVYGIQKAWQTYGCSLQVKLGGEGLLFEDTLGSRRFLLTWIHFGGIYVKTGVSCPPLWRFKIDSM